jgi:ankyrin repeat protein
VIREDLNAAVRAGDAAVVERLLRENGQGINELDGHGHTPLHWAVFGGYKEIVQLLLAHGADPNARAATGVTPLWNAVDFGLHEIATLLRDHGGRE